MDSFGNRELEYRFRCSRSFPGDRERAATLEVLERGSTEPPVAKAHSRLVVAGGRFGGGRTKRRVKSRLAKTRELVRDAQSNSDRDVFIPVADDGQSIHE